MQSKRCVFLRSSSRVVLAALVAHLSWLDYASAQVPIASASEATDPVSYDSLTLELATTEKTLADERYLLGDLGGAREYYCRARSTISGLDLNLDNKAQATAHTLLRADIEYRLLLLANGYGFWGAAQSLTPSIPQVHLKRLADWNAKFGTIEADIDAYVQRIGAGGVQGHVFYAQTNALEAQVNVQGVVGESLQIQRDFLADKQEALDSRVTLLLGERTVLENQYAAAKAQADAASAALTRAVTNAATSSVGIPPDLAQNIQEQQWEAVALSALQSPAVMRSPVVTSALADISANSEVLAGYVREGQALIAQGQQATARYQELRFAVETLRDPTLAGVLQVGEAVYAQMDPTTQKEWRQKVESTRPLVAAVELIQAADDGELTAALRAEAETYLAKEASRGSDILLGEARAYITRAQVDAGAFHRDLLARTATLTLSSTEAQRVFDITARSWSGALLAKVPATARARFVIAAGVTSEDELRARLTAQGLGAVQQLIAVQNQQIVIYNRASGNNRQVIATLPLNALHQVAQGPIERTGAAAQQELDRTLELLNRTEGNLRGVLVQALPAEAAVKAITAYVTPQSTSTVAQDNARQRASLAWTDIVNDLPAPLKERAGQKLAALQAGSVAVNQLTTVRQQAATAAAGQYQQNSTSPPPGVTPDAPSADDQYAQAAATMALNYFAPGAGVAIQVVASFSSFNEAVAKAERYAKALQANLAEQMQIEGLINEARLRQVVFSKEQEIAGIMRESARTQSDLYRSAIRQNNKTIERDRAKVALRRSLYFWLAEQQRREFDALNGSLAFWLGEPGSPRGLIARQVQTDPQNLRYALDSEIHLFDWLNRERESTRADAFGLRVHWDQMLALSQQACQNLGCAPGAARIGDVGQTDPVALTDLLGPGQVAAFRQWQLRRPNAPFTASVIIGPDNNIFARELENLRIVDVRIGRQNRSGDRTPLNRVHLAHPGVGYVFIAGEYRREALRGVDTRGLKAHESFDLDALRARWDRDNARTLVFEGYPAFSVWQLTFDSYKENFEVRPENVRLRFAYQYLSENPQTEPELIGAHLTAADFPGGELFDYLVTWQNATTLQSVSTAGGPRQVLVPAQGAAEVSASIVPLIAPLPKAADPCPPVGTAGPKPVPAPITPPRPPPQIVRVCKSDADIRRMLTEYYAARLGPGQNHAVARKQALNRFGQIKSQHCVPQAVASTGAR